ncbi:hypothetical protein E2C01_025356 [Portunus trituberculatus]|uniref:Uncharacterized protein n=1 Tax=Portunus trituberculatus TaxID=210409 RepID=A0A5B7EG90_PORTR|nr:hypothetical protein [Portunus trituberculatus]
MSLGGYWKSVCGEKEGNSSGSEDCLPESFPTFTAMMDFVCEKLPEACGPVVQDYSPLLLGMQRSEVPTTTCSWSVTHSSLKACSFHRFHQASEELTCANKSSKPSFAKYPVRSSIDEGRSLPAKVNHDLVEHLTVCGDPQVSLSQGEVMCLEEALLTTRDTQNFPHVIGIQCATVDQARITAFALANTRAVRRESYHSHLPYQFSSVSKAQPHHSNMDSDLLFDLASVEAIDQAQQAVSVSLTEAAAKALIETKPRTRTPLVDKYPRPSTSADSCPHPGPTQQRFFKPHFHPRTFHDSGRPSSRQRSRHFGNDSPSPTSTIGGCHARHQPTRGDMGAEEWVLRVLHEGYKITYHSFPPVSQVPQHLGFYLTDSERGRALMEEATIDTPCLLPTRTDLQQPHFHCFHASFHVLQLTSWKLSSDSSVIRAIPKELRSSWWDLDGVQPL